MQPEIFFKNEGIVALTGDASVDFTCDDFDAPLTKGQRAYLQKICGIDIPQVFWRKQIHGDDILVAHQSVIPAKAGIFDDEVYKDCPDADAFITDEKNLPDGRAPIRRSPPRPCKGCGRNTPASRLV